MKLKLKIGGKKYKADLSQPINISLRISSNDNPNCFFAPDTKIEPVVSGDFIGDTQKGGAVNFKNLFINPHGSCTHTECVGHISKEKYIISDCLQEYFFTSRLITVTPENRDQDHVITKQILEDALADVENTDALVIRTLPNDASKKSRSYSGTNPPYFDPEVILFLKKRGVRHLLTDLPSVDREQDEGKLASHKAFWNYPSEPKINDTITEMVFIKNEISDGYYLLNFQILNIELDASPSQVLLFPLETKN